MAAIVEKVEKEQISNTLTPSQSSGSSGLYSLGMPDSSDISSKSTSFGPYQKVNGLSQVNEELQLETSANAQCSVAVKIDTEKTLISSAVIKPEKELAEEPKSEELVRSEMECEPQLSQSIQDETPSPMARSMPCIKNEKVELKVPSHHKANNPVSTENIENKLSPCDANETKESLISLQLPDVETKDTVKPGTQQCRSSKTLSVFADEDKEEPLISENKMSTITSTLEGKDLQSDFNGHKLCKPADNANFISSSLDHMYSKEKPTFLSNFVIDYKATPEKDSADITVVADEKLLEKNNSKNCSENLKSKTFSSCLSAAKTEENSNVSNIPELLAYCSPCRVVVQDFFKELNIDLLELSRNFPVQHGHKRKFKKSKLVQDGTLDKKQITNSHDQTKKQAKCYTQNSKRRKKNLLLQLEELNKSDSEDKEDDLPLLSIRNNLQSGNTAENIAKKQINFTNTKTTAEGKNDKLMQTKGDNPNAVVADNRTLADSTSSNVSVTTTTSSNSDAADPFKKMSIINVSPTVNINDSNDLGLKIVSVSSQGSVFFPAFTNNANSENIVFTHSDNSSKLNGQLGATCRNPTKKLSAPKCKFHGTDSSPGQNLYKCKKCGLEAKNLSDIQSHMAGSHSEFCMYRCPFCVPHLPVKRVNLYHNRPIEFEVLQESSRKLLATAPSSAKTESSTIPRKKRKTPRHIRIERDKTRKLNYYYRNQGDLKKYKNEKN